MTYILNTDATSEILTLTELKIFLRLDGNDFDDILTPFITTSRQIGEKITGRDFVEKEYKTFLDYFPCGGIEIRKSKLKSITSIQYYDPHNTLQTFTDYYITNESDYSAIYANNSFPSTYDRKQAVIITFKVDYPNFPQTLKQAMLSVCAYLFENAGDCADIKQFKSLFFPYIMPQLFLV